MESNPAVGFYELPPEMVTEILERLENSPDALLVCRLVCSRLKLLIDEILERGLGSLWDWKKSHGEHVESSQVPPYIPIPKPHLSGKIFRGISDVDKFLAQTNLTENPFPSRGIHIWRLDKDRVPKPDLEQPNITEDLGKEKKQYTSYLEKSLLLFEKFGEHLTSLILESHGHACQLSTVTEFALILERTPNLKYLMLKRIYISFLAEDRKITDLPLPKLEYLESIKLIECNGLITCSIVSSYQSQVKTLQLVRNGYHWLQHFVTMQGTQQGNIFGELRELKLGALDYPSHFDFFTNCLRTQKRMGKPLVKLERLQFDYSIVSQYKFYNPIEVMFQVLEFLPKLKELRIGNSGSTKFAFDEDGKNLKDILSKICSSQALARIFLPVEFIQYPVLLKNIFKEKLRNLEQATFLDCNQRLWNREVEPENVLKLPRGKTLRMTVMDLMDGEGFSSLVKVSVVSCHENEERVICSVYK